MMTITAQAAEQIRTAARDGQMEGLPLRIAARRLDDGSIEYGMGFDEPNNEDTAFSVEGVEIVIAPVSVELLEDAVLDYVELEPGEFQFVFMNPNDPHYVAPEGYEHHRRHRKGRSEHD
ncbi:MAG: iron-sulfur cluster assembly accessory protein [Gammaproteobacteria bacterium]|nr:iron-sulfur cluster assembly accessory protein [Gammaproteobacteria bacterium]NIR85872.1 iron-sulfur cluster assembly accessory protein [Gammaproteobacteria bacterium]NIU07035.1 iron-sulfur cluster assembly accessory protein [Gammaproteobacteria bacterium]NIV53946.1 iron-sulfur cluster assembly accessory protein [Gammaproteobacteria bacterium]NIX88308.1 iron-sulfur cluster assembly accessory protein [Gammaproteobacteria bacterium]